MLLTGKSRVYGIFGDPIAHSLSPLMQNMAFRSLAIDAIYVPFLVTAEDLPKAIEGLRAQNIAGINLTIPHKEAVLPLLDQVDAGAALIGAVNTIVNQNGRLIGYNTDGLGFLRSAEQELDYHPLGSRVLLLGAGGACRAAVVALAAAQVTSICIANRSVERAERLRAELQFRCKSVSFKAVSYDQLEFQTSVEAADLIVNTTAVGLSGENIDFLPLEKIKPSALIYDMVYSKIETPLLRAAHSRGLRAVDGLGMLAAQGEEAFYLWTGKRPAAWMMKNCLQEYRING
jgi:shikimate dehydrogenase